MVRHFFGRIFRFTNCAIKFQAYALSPTGPVYAGPGASPTQATAEPFAADSPYFPFGTRSGSRLSPAKAKGAGGPAGPTGAIARGPKEEPQHPTAATTLDSQQWTAVVSFFFNHSV